MAGRESGWTVTEARRARAARGDRAAPHLHALSPLSAAYGRDVTRPYVRALEARHIAHVLVRGGSFNEREEVEAVRNALGRDRAARRRAERLRHAARPAVRARRRRPAALSRGLSARSIRFASARQTLPPSSTEVADALDSAARASPRTQPPLRSPTLSRVCSPQRARHAGIAIWPTGEQALANVMRLMDMARRYEASRGATSLRGFVDELEGARRTRAERRGAGRRGGHRGRAHHDRARAKGLEFPIVLLADLTCNETARRRASLRRPASGLCAQRLAGMRRANCSNTARTRRAATAEEAMRLLYVAATRARDLLIVPAVGDAPQDGWLGKLNPVIYPGRQRIARVALEPVPPGCPVLGDDRSSHARPRLRRSRAGRAGTASRRGRRPSCRVVGSRDA